MARLLSVNVGLPRDIEWQGRTVHPGIWKEPVIGRCRVKRPNLAGDGPPGNETDLLYFACLASLLLAGSGPLAVDRWIAVRSRKK